MKTYLFESYNRFKKYSETLDVKARLCNRTWIVFNDGGERELYKFKEDGTIRIILSGRVSSGTWEYDPNDKTFIITASGQSIMVHPGVYDNMLLALNVDGTDDCAFLIDENNANNFAPKTRTELLQYFEDKENKAIKAAEEQRKRQQQLAAAQEAARKQQAAREAARIQAALAAQEAERKQREFLNKRTEEIQRILPELETFLKGKGYNHDEENAGKKAGAIIIIYILLSLFIASLLFIALLLCIPYSTFITVLGVVIFVCWSVSIALNSAEIDSFIPEDYYKMEKDDGISAVLSYYFVRSARKRFYKYLDDFRHIHPDLAKFSNYEFFAHYIRDSYKRKNNWPKPESELDINLLLKSENYDRKFHDYLRNRKYSNTKHFIISVLGYLIKTSICGMLGALYILGYLTILGMTVTAAKTKTDLDSGFNSFLVALVVSILYFSPGIIIVLELGKVTIIGKYKMNKNFIQYLEEFTIKEHIDEGIKKYLEKSGYDMHI